MDDLTFVLAVIGTATGVAGTAIGVMGLIRDRAVLVASAGLTVDTAGGAEDSATLDLVIVNNGRQPVLVYRAGFSTKWRRQWSRWRYRTMPVKAFARTVGPEIPKRLEVGEHLRLTMPLATRNWANSFDDPPRGFALDSFNRVAWAKPRLKGKDLKQAYELLGWKVSRVGDEIRVVPDRDPRRSDS